VNGKSMGSWEFDHGQGRELVQCYQTAYEPGSIEAVAYDEEGHVIAREVRHSFGDAVKIHAEVEEVGRLWFIGINTRDAEGHPVENANNRIFVQVMGGGRLLGLDNGDSTDFENYQNPDRRLFSGKLLAVVERTSVEKCSVKISSYGLEGCELFLSSKENVIDDERLSYVNQNKNELPIRKIELAALESTHLTPEHPQVTIRMKLFPEVLNSQGYDLLEWKAVNDAGIELPFVEIRRTAEGLLVSAHHDGTIRLRVTAKNGKRSADVMSHLEMEVSGFGEGAIDPYREVLTALSTERNPYAVEGIEHGINCLGESEEGKHAIFGFERVDFGSCGTEEVTVYLFANTNHAVSLRIWDGYPGKAGSRLLVDGNYHKKPEWMVFQPESYQLPERLTGEGGLYFETEDAYQFKSFVFTEIMKAYEGICAADCDRIYGDAFQKTDTAVEKIGNNVGIVFEHLNLGAEGAERIVIKGRTSLSVQPIQIRWTADLNWGPGEKQPIVQTGSGQMAEQKPM
ncbi:MAG: DUF4982 domain-containing protein, partial [Lachnospiraceae bacterium]|nr:DUF4982 domain-containing protein [Lachnospiraceae bacterium]